MLTKNKNQGFKKRFTQMVSRFRLFKIKKILKQNKLKFLTKIKLDARYYIS